MTNHHPAPDPTGKTTTTTAETDTGPEVLWLPVTWVLENYRSTEWSTWPGTLAAFRRDHTHLEQLQDDIATHGVRTPVELNPDRGEVHRGHHRLLLADLAGVGHVPVVFAHLDETTYWDPETRRDVVDDYYDEWEGAGDMEGDGEWMPWVEVRYRVPDTARAMALPPGQVPPASPSGERAPGLASCDSSRSTVRE